jgi:hypothetical protein
MTDQRREDLERRIADMGRYRPLAGAVVLEIGADAKSFAAQMLLDAGAARVISSNHGERWPEETVGAIEKKRIDARKLTDVLAPQSVDIVFGIAVLEHIDGLAEFFRTAKQVLRPGGLFFVQGEPIWTSQNGHHVGVIGERAHYRFGVPGANPIPRWAHLTNTRESLPRARSARRLSARCTENRGLRLHQPEDQPRRIQIDVRCVRRIAADPDRAQGQRLQASAHGCDGRNPARSVGQRGTLRRIRSNLRRELIPTVIPGEHRNAMRGKGTQAENT